MKRYNLFLLFSLCSIIYYSCNITTKEKEIGQTELKVREPLKSILDSLIALDKDKNLIQEMCINIYDVDKYRISLISRSYSLDKEYGKPINYFMSNGKKIDIYTGLELFFQPLDSATYKENRPPGSPVYRVLEFNAENGKLVDLKELNPHLDIPFLLYSLEPMK